MIALHNIAKSYPLPRGKKVVLDDVNITFRPGENMGILGLNGAGKSTLMQVSTTALAARNSPTAERSSAKAGCRGPSALREVSTGASRVGRICASLPASMVPISGK